MSKRLPAELGDLVEVHRPMRGYTGWIPVLLPGLVFGGMAAVLDPGPIIGLLVFVMFSLPLAYGTGEWFLLEHRFHRHGVVFRSLVPGLKTYVVPYRTCDPDSLGTIGRRVHDGTDLSQAVGRRFRQCPLTGTNLLLTGLDPMTAKAIAAGREPWTPGFRSSGISWTGGQAGRGSEQWLFSSRTPEHHTALLRDLIVADRATR